MFEVIKMAAVDLGTMEFDTVERINNADIINLVSWVDTGIRQFATAPSANRTDAQVQDIDILDAWIARFEQYFKHFASEPELYMPMASPKPKPLPAPPADIKIVQNPVLQMMMYQLSHMRTQLLFCESSERLNGFHPQESTVVITPWIDKQKAFAVEARNNLSDPAKTWMPEVNTQPVPVNVGNPR